jgi:hypothetical protein
LFWGGLLVDQVKRRLLLTMAALSPGVVTVTLHEFALSMALMVLGVFGAISIAAAAVAVFPQSVLPGLETEDTRRSYPSLVMTSALDSLRDIAPDPTVLRAQMEKLLKPAGLSSGFMTEDDQVAMVLAQIMARWNTTDAMLLSDDQIRELWLVDRLMRATPAEAGALSKFFTAPNAMLTMRDTLAAPVSA